ncbi:MAG: type II secretion system protein [Aliarcobacter sp.]|nr:type II secretion system protein [Aliarcobacter sp.]
MVKNSFTLLETLISITFLSIVISGFLYSSYHDKTNQENFMILNDLENRFDTKNYSNFTKTNQNLQIVKNKETTDNIVVSKYQFENENIKLFKYEK